MQAPYSSCNSYLISCLFEEKKINSWFYWIDKWGKVLQYSNMSLKMFGSSLPKALRYNFFSIFVIQLINRNLVSVQENILQKHVCEKK